ncbi:MAG: hypothetical protein JSV21_09995, partial [Nitrospirota bacterium]
GCKSTGTTSSGKVLRDIPREERVALMVLNFKNTTAKSVASEYDPWQFGIPSMIMTDLESIGLFNIISWERLEDILEQQKIQHLGLVEEDDAVEMGKIVAARFTLAGAYMVMNGKLVMEAKIYSVESGALLGASSVTGRLDRFFELEKQLVIKMTEYLGATLTDSERDEIEKNIETTSLYASLSNYAGEMVLHEAEDLKAKGKKDLAKDLIDKARSNFEAALNYDPGYERARNNLASLAMALPMTL